MVKSTIWAHRRNPYDIYMFILKDPRLPITQLARKMKVNPKTADIWWIHALKKQIIMSPRFRRKSFLNFREYVYFLKVKDPHAFYEQCTRDRNLVYFSVHTGFCNFQIVSKKPIEPEGEIILSGPRSDYHVTIPPDITFQQAGEKILKKLNMIDHFEHEESPLLFRSQSYDPWDDKDERLYEEFCNNLRKPMVHIMKKTSTYSDKIMNWFRTRDQFGHTITMFFPQGLHSYMPVTYALETEFDSVLIHLFSELPTPCVFYKIDSTLMMSIYLPFTLEGRILIRKAFSVLQKEELVRKYTNSNIDYFYRLY
jgi:hypothetical protein